MKGHPHLTARGISGTVPLLPVCVDRRLSPVLRCLATVERTRRHVDTAGSLDQIEFGVVP